MGHADEEPIFDDAGYRVKPVIGPTGIGDPRGATSEKGQLIFERLVEALVPVLDEFSKARPGQFPYHIHKSTP